MAQIIITGQPKAGARTEAIADAIRIIQADPAGALKREYIGVKQYAGFGDQRADCEYGMGPKHGSVVFSIGRVGGAGSTVPLGPDAIYLLEAFRDFPGVKVKNESSDHRIDDLNLCGAILKWDQLGRLQTQIGKTIWEAFVETHEQEPPAL
jgi:hypothetical protein